MNLEKNNFEKKPELSADLRDDKSPNPIHSERMNDSRYGTYAPSERDDYAPVMTVGDWIKTMLLLAIPIVNIILVFVWAFSSTANPNKRNYFRASLILGAVSLFIILVLVITGNRMILDSL